MSDQWVDQQGYLRNSSGRYPTGQRSPASIEMEKDNQQFEVAKHYSFTDSPQNAWAISCRPKLAAIFVNTKNETCVGIEIEHARQLRNQLNYAIKRYEELREDMVSKPEETRQMLLDNAGIIVDKKET